MVIRITILRKYFAIYIKITVGRNSCSCYTPHKRMKDQITPTAVLRELQDFFAKPNSMRSLLLLAISLFIAYWISRILARLIIYFTQKVAVRADSAPDEKQVQLRRVETYLGVTVAVVKVFTVAIVGYITWSIIARNSSPSIAAVGAGTLFIVLAGGTIGPLLRDVTAGATMIVERWFNVGDFIRVEPFIELGGVVERMTLRSTKIRSLNGEIVWLHNQYMQGVRMTPRGIRTIHVDVFVKNLHGGKELVDRVSSTIPVGTMTLVQKIAIINEEKWAENRWLLTVEGKTPPGREWLMETYFVDSLKELDEQSKQSVLIRKPIVRYADPAAERSFKRAVRPKI